MNSILSYFMPSSSAKESEADKKTSVTITGEVVLSKSVKFYKYSAKTCEFELYSADKKEFQIGLVKEKKFTYSLFVKDGSNPVLLQPFDYTMSPVFRRDFLSFIWNYPASSHGDSQPSSSGTITLSCVFSKKEDEEEFRVAFMKAYFETTCQTEYTEAEGGYINDVYMEPMESEESDEDAAEVETEESESEVEEVSTPSKIASGTRGTSRSGTSHTPQKIKGMSLTYTPNTNKSFVLRGDDIGVFDTLSGQFNTSLSIKGTPSKLMMYDQDTSLILNDINNFSKLNKYDVETQKIVNEWHIEKDGVELEAGHMFTPSKKYGQMTSEQVFLSGGKNLLMTLDPRMSNPVANYNMYKTNPAFSSMTTAEDGNIAVVGKDGDLRLYDKVDKRAKTFMKGLGGTPIGVDVSNDGKWCLVTFDCYLLLVECVRDGASGYTKSLGKDKPIPKRLQLKPEHAALVSSKYPISFTTAKFNLGGPERKIVTSTGPYVITWNFRRVLQGKLYDYTIKQYEKDVVAETFRYQEDSSVVVATQDDVKVSKTGEFQSAKKVFGQLSPKKKN